MQIIPNRVHVGGKKVAPIDLEAGLLHPATHRVEYPLDLVALVHAWHVAVVQNAVQVF